MKNIPSALLSFLEGTESYNRADLILVQLTNGVAIAATTAQQNITYGGTTYWPSRYGSWERGKVRTEVSFAPKSNEMELTVGADSSVLLPGTEQPSVLLAAQVGLFDAALVTVLTIYWGIGEAPSVGAARGALKTFVGVIAGIDRIERTKVVFRAMDMVYLLNQNTPPNVIQSGCRHKLFDAGCALLSSNFQMSNSIATGSNNYFINLATDVSTASFWNSYMTFSQGQVKFTSGPNNGLRYYIKKQVSTKQLQLGVPLKFSPSVGSNVLLFPGCDKSTNKCLNQFNNLIHFGGMPYVPDPETAI